MDALQVFKNESWNVRTVDLDGQIWFVGKDVADMLGYVNASKAFSDHCKGVTNRYPLLTAGGVQDVRIISEPDLYRLIANSTLPEAVRFEAWIFEEVLPTIRRTGSYSTKALAVTDRLIESVKHLGLTQGQIEEDAGVSYLDFPMLAKFMRIPGLTQKALIEISRSLGIIDCRGTYPSVKGLENGYVVRDIDIRASWNKTKYKTVWTPKGVAWLMIQLAHMGMVTEDFKIPIERDF